MLNGIKYLGMHSTDCIEDGYLGSGLKLVNAVAKHGRANFSRRVLHVFDNREAMVQMERQLVTQEICESPLYYNMMVGGDGGRVCSASIETIRQKSKTRWDLSSEEDKQKQIDNWHKNLTPDRRRANSLGEKNAMFGRKWTEAERQKLSDSNLKRDRRDHKFLHKDGEIFIGQVADFYKNKNLCRAWTSRVISGEKKTIKGWSYKGLVE